MIDKVLSWFATSPLSSAVRVALAAALTYLLENISGFNFDPAVQVILVGLITSALRYFNPADGVFGFGKTEVE